MTEPDGSVLLSAALIVRDEAEHLRGCLDSLDGLVDEIVVVDTGSTDGSPDIAASAGAHVTHLPWTGDFSAARNAAVDRCRGRWILYIDADERVRPGAAAATRAVLETSDALGLLVEFTPATGFTWYRECRLFRNDPAIRFERPIHERVVPAIERLGRARSSGGATGPGSVPGTGLTSGAVWGRVPLHLDHLGYDHDRPSRHRRDLPLLEGELAHRPGDVSTWYRLGVARAGLGDGAGAEEAWRQGDRASAAEGDTHPLGGMCLVELVRLSVERDRDPGALLAGAVARFPRNRLLAWHRARHLLATGDLRGAAAAFGALAATDLDALAGEGLAYDARLFGSWAHDGAGAAAFALEEYEAAAAAYAAAEAAEPGVLGYRVKRVAAARRAEAVRSQAVRSQAGRARPGYAATVPTRRAG
jgi:hypothetical protein